MVVFVWLYLDYAAHVQAESRDFFAQGNAITARTIAEALPVSVAALGAVILLLLRRDIVGFFLAGFVAFSALAAAPVIYRHYLVQVVPSVALAAGVGISRLCAWCRQGAPRWCLPVGISAVIACFPVAVRPTYYVTGTPHALSRQLFGGNPFPEARDVASYVAARTDEGEHVFILGSEAEILFYANRDSPTRFALKYPLGAPWSRHREAYQQNVMDILEADPPKYIIRVDCKASLPWGGTSSLPLKDFIVDFTKSRYTLEAIQPVLRKRADLIQGSAVASALAAGKVTKGAIFIYRRL
jgi:hypothetical protein